MYIGQRGDSLADIPAENPDIDEAYSVRAGKLRRYSGEGLKQLLDAPTVLKNIRDSGRVIVGLAEARRLLKKLKPDVIFIKGGFVGVPVGLAAAQLGIPYVTHDSDAIPGLANRIIGRWAAAHAVALPKGAYNYPLAKTYTVGVPINHEFQPVSPELQAQYRQQLGLAQYERIIFVTGGGNGARQLNSIVVASAKALLEHDNSLAIVHLAGRAFTEETEALYEKELPADLRSRIIIKSFITNLYCYSGSADVIIGRGSATNLAEFALQAKPCIIVPARQLAWTVKNTEALVKQGAIIALNEDELLVNSAPLVAACNELLNSATERAQLGKKLSTSLAHPNSARELAELLLRTKSD